MSLRGSILLLLFCLLIDYALGSIPVPFSVQFSGCPPMGSPGVFTVSDLSFPCVRGQVFFGMGMSAKSQYVNCDDMTQPFGLGVGFYDDYYCGGTELFFDRALTPPPAGGICYNVPGAEGGDFTVYCTPPPK